MAGLLVRWGGGPLSLCASQVYCMIYGTVHSDNAMANANMTVWRFQVRQLYYREDYVIAKNSGHAAGVYGEIDYIPSTPVCF
jgi:hypothetical protein